MSDIFEEVDEALAHDNYAKLWHNIRWFVYGLIALIILGVGGWEIMKWNDARTQEAYAEEFYAAQQALQANDYVAANALFEEILNSDSPFAEMAAHYVALNQFTNFCAYLIIETSHHDVLSIFRQNKCEFQVFKINYVRESKKITFRSWT